VGVVRDFTLKAWFPLAVLMLMPWIADAAGLGRINVLSSMGQPLRAEIELVSVEKEELATLSVRLASPDDYRKANLQYGAAAAGVRLSIERRADGRPYILVTSQQAVNDPFVDLLIELNWASGRLMREYTALLDPPEYAAAAPQPAPMAVAPAVRPAPAPQPLAAAPAVREPAAAGTYGPVQRGETLGAIARSLKPDDVTLEQMLVGLYRSNPDAFIRKNMNLVRSGKILRVPDRQELAAIPREEAAREYRAQVADWNAYRARLAEAVPAATDTRTAAAGRITGRVEDRAAAEPKDVVRLSKGEAPGALAPDGKPRAAAERIRTLEEELVAREKALEEAKERIAQLEKTIRDMQRLAELKSPALAAAQQQAEAKLAPKPDAAPETKPEAKPEAAKAAEAAPAAKPEAKPEAKPAAKPAPPKPAPPPPEPALMDTLTDPLYLGAGGGIVALLLAYLLVRRRRAAAVETPEKPAPATNPSVGAATAAVAAAATVPAAKAVSPAAAAIADDDLDPVAEAAAYLSLGRDAQAEEVLKEALEKGAKREEVHVKLLEIYAARKDKGMFAKYAGEFNKLTGGRGPNWVKVAAMGYALEPENALYAAGREVIEAAPSAPEAAAPVDLDFNLDMPEPAGAAAASRPEEPQPAGPLMPDFNLEVPADAPAPAAPASAAPPSDGSIDFNLELPPVDAPPKPAAAAPAQDKEDAGLDFKLDISGLDLELGDKPKPAGVAGAGKDAHWYDVQTKFDLARAYQEMGDRSGAREILEEVLKEGDAEQQEQARKLLDTLG
jgi:pilus assembly protein FimV